MNIASSALIALLERELAGHTPEIEAFILQGLGIIAKDLMAYLEKKIAPANQAA